MVGMGRREWGRGRRREWGRVESIWGECEGGNEEKWE